MFLALLGLIQQTEGFVLSHSHTRTLQTAASPQVLDGRRLGAVVATEQSGPPPLDTGVVHVFDVSLGGADTAKLALTQVPSEKKGVLALWRFMMAHEAGGEADRLERARDELQAEMALAADSSVFGAYLNGSVDGDEHGLALVRFEGADEDDGKQIMIIHTVLISPMMPEQMRPALQQMVAQSLRAIGEANGMCVRLWAEYNI